MVLKMKYSGLIFRLNNYILLEILKFTTDDLIKTILTFSRVCKKFHQLATSDDIWFAICSSNLGE